MKSIAQLLLNYGTCCLNCGSLQSGRSQLCDTCAVALESLRKYGAIYEAPLKIQPHFYWYPGESDLLSRLILHLKGSGSCKVWRHYAEQFIKQTLPRLPQDRPLYIVPAPSRKEKDHAYYWAEALAGATGGIVIPCLKKKGTHHQRGADRGERALLEMELDEKYTQAVELSDKALWIFADDVLTTGSTARAAHNALGNPKHFEVWVLAQRGLSCRASKSLL